jgi:hypothetical protein
VKTANHQFKRALQKLKLRLEKASFGMWFVEVFPLAESIAAAWVSLDKSVTRGMQLPPFVVVEAWSGKIAKSSADLAEGQAMSLEDFIQSRESWGCSPFETLFLLRCPEGFSPMPMAAGVWVEAGSSAAYAPQAHTLEEAKRIIDYWLLEIADAPLTPKKSASGKEWTSEAETEARRLITAGTVTTAAGLREMLAMRQADSQALFRHITGKQKKKHQTN